MASCMKDIMKILASMVLSTQIMQEIWTSGTLLHDMFLHVKDMTLAEDAKKAIWFKSLASDLDLQQRSVTIQCNNQSKINLAKYQVFPERTKDIEIDLH